MEWPNGINHLFINDSESICLSSSCGKCSRRDLHVFGEIIGVYAPHTVVDLLLSVCVMLETLHCSLHVHIRMDMYNKNSRRTDATWSIDSKRLDFDFERVSDLNDGVHDHHSPLIGKLIDDNIDDVS